ncbi:phosphate acyltransferase [Vagococcus salmoninarum]|uniref:phosphate acyltransferase n=1 Tax=Vagococcus salmoninarum TaxID=2739 RepID=UPI001881EC02|nr:phosphate acyltransferase [Vagococcus salmoninarum]MBE9389340.1 phosphotransacetylase [Vagococcus salmoninarum]
MITVSVPGGSQPEILELVKKAHESYPEQLQFVVFDTAANIDKENQWTYVQCPDEATLINKAVAYVASGQAQILLKGIIQTHVVLKEVLQKEHDLKKQKVLSHVAMIQLPEMKRPILLTDSAMNIAPTTETLIEIVTSAKEVAHKVGISQPKIALLSAAENFNPKMPSSVLATEVTEHFVDSQDGTVFGPLSLDLAMSEDSVQHKRYEGPIMGDADVLVVPAIDAGNFLYKSLTMFGGALVGGTLVGTKVPIVLTSRSDSMASKLYSLEFAMKQI